MTRKEKSRINKANHARQQALKEAKRLHIEPQGVKPTFCHYVPPVKWWHIIVIGIGDIWTTCEDEAERKANEFVATYGREVHVTSIYKPAH